MKANILFWLCCLPLVTIPAALKALSRVCVTLLRGESCDLGRDWWATFRDSFLRTTGAGALAALLLFAVGTGIRFYGAAMAGNGLLAVPAVLLLVLAAMTAGYLLAYPYSSFALGAIALSLFWLIACFTAWPGLEKYVFHTIEQEK